MPSRQREEQKRPASLAEAARREPLPIPELAPRPGEKGWQPPARLPSIQMGKFLGRLAIAVAILVVLINIPVKSHGVSLARILPDTASLIIRDGLVLKGTGTEIYILQDDKLRWISSLDVFEHLGLTWADVHVVDDAFLKQFEMDTRSTLSSSVMAARTSMRWRTARSAGSRISTRSRPRDTCGRTCSL